MTDMTIRAVDAEAVARLARLARLLDARFRIPGTPIRFGLDGLLGLLPIGGDVATAFLGALIVVQAARLGVPRADVARMAGNVAVDVVIGSVPLVGDVFDLFFKSNLRNLEILERHAASDEDRKFYSG